MKDNKDISEHFYGTTTVGEKGQICIPAEARQSMGVERGEKLLAFGMGKNMLVLVKLSELAEFESHLAERLEAIRGILASTGSEPARA